MRPIKFRAYDADDKVMRSWEEIDFTKDIGDDYYMVGYKASPVSVKYDHKQILMQYTGLKDKDGVEIYEGDIVKWGHLNQWSREQPHRIAEVKFGPDIQFHSQVGVFNFGSFAYRDTTETDLEVIGNIWEDPELLEEEE